MTSASTASVQAVVDLVKQGVGVEEAVSRVDGVSQSVRTVMADEMADPDYGSLIFGLPVDEIAGPFPIDETPTAVMGHERCRRRGSAA